MNRNTIYNDRDERMFDILEDEEGIPKLQVKTGKGKNAYRYMDAKEAVEKITQAIENVR